MRWHREDGWQEGDLPQGWRPLHLGEPIHERVDQWKQVDENSQTWTERVHIYPDECTGAQAKKHSLHRTRRPLTFTHEGKQWTWHRPGDPMPCDGEKSVFVLFQNGDALDLNQPAEDWKWGLYEKADTIIGWRYADEKKTVPLGPEDVLPGSVLSLKPPRWFIISGISDNGLYVLDDEPLVENLWRWEYLMEKAQINRSIPLTGKWNPDAWEACSKQIPA